MSHRLALSLFLLTVLVSGCRNPVLEPKRQETRTQETRAPRTARLGFSIQAGAFAKVENAANLAERLRNQGLEATYFAASDGLYKVRFGDFETRDAARARAVSLQASATIATFYIVAPESAAAISKGTLDGTVRESLCRTAHTYVGLPYLWGGASAETGFDCSGLTQAVYRMNGLRIPRSSREQFETGLPVERSQLRKGDLLFFATSGRGKISHVAIYIGDGQLIHAPGRGRTIQKDSLDNPVLSKQFLGGRSYV
jgi:cell wall-associated NlpC family hydrolase